MRLYTETFGRGPDLVLLHGWGLHAGVWEHTASELAKSWRVTLVDLPGHGRSPAPGTELDLNAMAQAVAAGAPAHAAWMGWSLGGMIATHLAVHNPARVAKLILVASSPRFVTAEDWPHAMDLEVLQGFARDLETDYRGTLERFVSLQVNSVSTGGRETLRALRNQLSRYPAPPAAVLRSGLRILATADLRAVFGAISRPTLMIFGERDKLVPASLGQDMHRLLPAARLATIAGAGHAPFLSHPPQFIATLETFLHAGA